MKRIFAVIALFLTISIYAERIDFTENSGSELFECNSSDLYLTEFDFALDGFDMDIVQANGIDFQKISYANEGEFLEFGKPDLPRFTRLVAIPNKGNVSVNISNSQTEILTGMNVYPRQNLQSESQPTDRSFMIDNEFYSTGNIFPGRIVESDSPAIMRDYRVVNITINPFQYDPVSKELEIIKNLSIEVTCSGRDGENIKTGSRLKSRAFEPLYRSSIINYEQITSRTDEYQQSSYLFIYDDDNNHAVANALQPLLDWKHEKGFEVHAIEIPDTGSDIQTIRQYIQDAYDNWTNPPEFLCIVGDAGGTYNIPTAHIDPGMYNGEGDHFYGLLEGDDILTDVFIGRLSFNTLFELQTIIYKIFHYEKEPYMNETDWYNRALMVGDPTDSGTSCIDTKMHIKEMIDEHAGNIVSTEVYNGQWVTHINNNLNNGVSYFNYRGFANMSGWQNNHIDNLSNGHMLPVVSHITCITGDFEGTVDCRSEAFLKAGSPGDPKGAIAAIGTATGNTHTCFNNCVDAGTFYGVFADQIYNMGGALARGKLALYNNYPGNPENHVAQFSYWNNLMGDPGMEIWTGIPQQLIVTYPSQIPIGSNFIEVIVEDASGSAIENAWVTALMGDDEIFSTGYSDESGRIFLPLDDTAGGNVNLTVTKHNFKPHLGGFDIEQGMSFISVLEIDIDDDNSGTSSGNNDGNINPGENIEFGISLQNHGSLDAGSVSADISSESEFVTITDDTESYGNIPAGNSSYSNDDFDLTIAENTLGGTEIRLDVFISDGSRNEWNDIVYFTVEGAYLHPEEYSVNDGNNNILDPGETVEMVVSITNLGTLEITDIYGTLSCPNSQITIQDAEGYFGEIHPGEQASNSGNSFEITANTQILPGSQFDLELHLHNSSGYDQTTSFVCEVGEVFVDDPLGPDVYGYYCYDDEDTEYFSTPQYQWIEIDPNYGGSGTELQLYDFGNTGDIESIALPISFRFYGENYDSITICSNGWLAPGNTNMTSFMNWEIPGTLGPSPIIAPFWDDLIIADGSVCYYYDSIDHYFVVEWSRVYNEFDNSIETFEVILYDSNYYQTTLGDSEIKFQYNEINNVDQGSYGGAIIQHGQYATVGIEDQTGQIGLEYSFNNQYPSAAKPLENEMAILFTGPSFPIEEPYLVLGTINIYDENENGIIDHGETVNIAIPLNNIGGNPATNVSATLSSTDDYVTVTNNFSDYNDVDSGSSEMCQSNYSFEVDGTCPHGHVLLFRLDVISAEGIWELYFGLDANAPQIEIEQISMNDGNNGILDPGESGDLTIIFANNGGTPAYSVIASIDTDDQYFTVNTVTDELGNIDPGETISAFYNVTAAENAPIGHEVEVGWEIQTDNEYAYEGIFSTYLVQMQVSFEEDFLVFPPVDWIMEGNNWIPSESNFAGGEIPEAAFIWFPPFDGTQRFITPPVETLGSSELELEFKHLIADVGGGYELFVQTTSDGEIWHDLISFPADNIPPTTENILIANSDVGSGTFQLSFTFTGSSLNINAWIIDDVVLNEVTATPHGYIEGIITLNGEEGNVADVIVSAGDNFVNPNNEGYYVIPLDPGTYNVSAHLPGYISNTVMGVVIENLWETTSANITLDEATIDDIPQNLIAEHVEDNISLHWDIPGSFLEPDQSVTIIEYDRSDKNIVSKKNEKDQTSGSRFLTGYNIYRNNELIYTIDDISITYFDDHHLDNGDYEYYVTAIYSEGESAPSNTVNVIIILAAPTGLSANHISPNVLLQWTSPGWSSLTGFKIYRNDEFLAENSANWFMDPNIPSGTYEYYVTAMYGNYESDHSNTVEIDISSAENEIVQYQTELLSNYPNPFNPKTSISFSLKEDSKINLEVFDIRGRKVTTLLNSVQSAGIHSVTWEGLDENDHRIGSGIYFYKLTAGNYSKIRKMILLQ